MTTLLESLRAPGRGACGIGAIVDPNPSHDLLRLALAGLKCMEHRGGSIEDTGDGAGVLLATDQRFFARFIAPDRHLPEGHSLSVGVVFFPPAEETNLPHWQRTIDSILRRHGLSPMGWRHVPVDYGALGHRAAATRKDIWQVLVGEGYVRPEDLRRTFHKVKTRIEDEVRDIYLPSFAPHTVVYKALATGRQLARFYADLTDESLRTTVALFHRRYSTNTFSNWYLAQPFRNLCHNGEINTIAANRNALRNLARQLGLDETLMPQGSDSADVDRAVEIFAVAGISLLETVTRLMPAAWRDLSSATPEVIRFYQGVQRALGSVGAWEGPAAVIATDGQYVAATLDRMGLRPLRWMRTTGGRTVIGSEVGAVAIPFEEVAESGQLGPGEAMAIRVEDGALLHPWEVLEQVVANTPINFAALSEHRLVTLAPQEDAPAPDPAEADAGTLRRFGWSRERQRVVRHMARAAKEPVTSMGYDRPLPAMSARRPPLAKYFKQIVAVVTNPPIDPIREGSAFDLTVHLGAAPVVHQRNPIYEPLPQYRLPSPFLTHDQMQTIARGAPPELPAALILDATFEDPGNGPASGAKTMAARVAVLCQQALEAVKRREAQVLVLSDRACLDGTRLPLPMPILTSALNEELIADGRRRRCGIVVETGEVQEAHDAAVLVGAGADAVQPYVLLALGAKDGPAVSVINALDAGLRRIMSKMGICTVDGYRGSRLFEAVGVSADVIDHYFPGMTSRVGGIDLGDIYEDIVARTADPVPFDPDLAVYRKEVWQELQLTARGEDLEAYGRFLALIAATPPVYLRDLMRLHPANDPRAIDAVVPEEQIIRETFRAAAMSHGALHGVAHRAIAAAFNSFGALSNCGEGGEDPRRDRGGPWEESRSRIRQVASGRFGVEARYLAHADELEIKIGQGAKPGEGGMLPGAKVTAEIAHIRKTKPGVTLISPPPHHDIYSIEDLAQLVHNLRQANPEARIGVKLPAVTDIGTIAVGVAKAGADVITVSGFEGGTGAAIASSIEHAGLPLERALVETHAALVINGVRSQVVIRADGGIKTGFDVVALLCLGADDVSLGTALMIAEQCVFCHGCAAGNCPAGITTQDPLVARRLMTDKKGRGKDAELPEASTRFLDAREGVKRYLLALAGDVRERMARLGVRRPAELVGRVDLLERRVDQPIGQTRAHKLDLSELLADPYGQTDIGRKRPRGAAEPRRIDRTSAENARIVSAAARGERSIDLELTNGDHAVGATLAAQLVRGTVTLQEEEGQPGVFQIRATGYAGQAFGFALVDGMSLTLTGFANDTVGEAMSGGVIAVRPPDPVRLEARHGLSVAGNSVGYGATGGRLFIAGSVGQRVGVRNSGCTIVVEGAGKYAFEYMTGGAGVVLGPVGAVVASGITGGRVFVLADECPLNRIHPDATADPPDAEDDIALRGILAEHHRRTASRVAHAILERWEAPGQGLALFRKIVPA